MTETCAETRCIMSYLIMRWDEVHYVVCDSADFSLAAASLPREDITV